MKILFTGGSSFSGFWFVSELAKAGHEVVATFQQQETDYNGLRARRVAKLEGICRRKFDCSLGHKRFFELLHSEKQWDVFCHHGADVRDYKSPDFNIAAALDNNTRELKETLKQLKERGCQKVVLTGSIFEKNEGHGEDGDDLPAVSPYGVSKGLTAAVFHFYARLIGLSLGKYVIPNPFGPYEEPRFTAYLIRCWRDGKVATVNTPDYVRDNIHVSLMARDYANFVSTLPASAGYKARNPSGYVESQGAFACRFAAEMEKQLGIACAVELKQQSDFNEPMKRINSDKPDEAALNWSEKTAWDDIAEFYRHEMV